MNCIEVKDFGFRYPNAERPALSEIRMKVEEGSFTVLCGKSGCGKSTLLRHLKTVLAPHGEKKGMIRYMGKDLRTVDQRTQAAGIGYVLQNPENQIVTDKVWHELAFGLESLGYDTPTIRLCVGEMASYFGIQEWFRKNVNELSGGQKQLLNLASVMAMHPCLLILDEPTSQLDPIAASDFLETIRRINRDIGTTVLLTEQRLENVIPWADQVYVMEEGQMMVHGTPEDVGKFLKDKGHDMFLSMPAPMQICAGVRSLPEWKDSTGSSVRFREDSDSGEPSPGRSGCPLTVRQGRRWLRDLLKSMVPGPASKVLSGSFPGPSPETLPASSSGPAFRLSASESASGLSSSETASGQSSSETASGQSSHEPFSGTAGKKTGRVHQNRKQQEIPEIRIRDVWFRYERDLPDVIQGLSLEIRKREIFALVGGNGTGKSTAMSLIAGIRSPYRGKIWLEGREIGKYSDDELYHGFLGVMPQDPQSLFVKKTVREDLYEMIDGKRERKSKAYPIDMKKADAVKGIAVLTKLGHLLDRHPYDLSGGEQQRLALAKVLLLRPRILLMDEPTKGMDNHYKRELGEILRTLTGHGVTVLMISHDIEFCAQYADRTGLFFQGNVVACKDTASFFAGNQFYTTAANRMARQYFPKAVTVDDVINAVSQVLKKEKEDLFHAERG